MKAITVLRDFPSVEELLEHRELAGVMSLLPRPAAAEVVRSRLAKSKAALKADGKPIPYDRLLADIRAALVAGKRQEITRVINATGIIVHTNLGRTPLPESLFDTVKKTVCGYCNVEFDLQSGSRGRRGVACERYLALLAGAEAATVVNNCAAALFLVLNTFATRKQVIISRGELVQIGGGFRIPDILKKSGAKLCEVGTTNITTVADYEKAIDPVKTGLILKVHQSNFVQGGFTETPSLKDLVALGKKHDVMVVNDLGSGVFVSTRDIVAHEEPTVGQSVRTGAAVTTFSGDKLLGAVQAGLIVGSTEHLGKIKRNALFRTMRVDKYVFAMLEQIFAIYLDSRQAAGTRLWQVLSQPEAALYQRARRMVKEVGPSEGISIEATRAQVGGGALPGYDMPSVAIVFSREYKASSLMKKFRDLDPPIIGRIDNERFLLDLKAVGLDDASHLVEAIRSVCGHR